MLIEYFFKFASLTLTHILVNLLRYTIYYISFLYNISYLQYVKNTVLQFYCLNYLLKTIYMVYRAEILHGMD